MLRLVCGVSRVQLEILGQVFFSEPKFTPTCYTHRLLFLTPVRSSENLYLVCENTTKCTHALPRAESFNLIKTHAVIFDIHRTVRRDIFL